MSKEIHNHAIRWTEETWNPIPGCFKKSAGCKNCYAITMAHRIAGIPGSKTKYAGLTTQQGNSVNWTGKATYGMDLKKPVNLTSPRMIFVNSMGDTFYEKHPRHEIAKIFAIMWYCHQHTFQVLTKRPERAAELMETPGFIADVVNEINRLSSSGILPKNVYTNRAILGSQWPLKNVWIGTTIENDEVADQRLAALKKCKAHLKFISFEPLIWYPGRLDLTGIDWAICGGESGIGARPMHPAWARALLQNCRDYNVPFFFKQWGSWLPWEPEAQLPFWKSQNGKSEDSHLLFPDDWDAAMEKNRWDDGMWTVQTPFGNCAFQNVGKKEAGNRLDGVVYEEFPVKK